MLVGEAVPPPVEIFASGDANFRGSGCIGAWSYSDTAISCGAIKLLSVWNESHSGDYGFIYAPYICFQLNEDYEEVARPEKVDGIAGFFKGQTDTGPTTVLGMQSWKDTSIVLEAKGVRSNIRLTSEEESIYICGNKKIVFNKSNDEATCTVKFNIDVYTNESDSIPLSIYARFA